MCAAIARALSSALSANVLPVSGHVGRVGELVESDEFAAEPGVGEDAVELGDLVRVPGREHDPRDASEPASARRLGSQLPPSATVCRRVSSAQPAVPRSSRLFSSARENGSPSAVPWISTKSPVPVQTTFMSVSAVESSS